MKGLIGKICGLAAAAMLVSGAALAGPKKIVLVAGTPSHGPGEHEFNAGVKLLKKCLDGVPGVQAVECLNGWPKDAATFDGADSIVLYMDGGGGHPAIQDDHLQKLGALMDKGVGLVCIHYAVEIPKEKGGPEFLKWIGGYYETGYSINPHWEADLKIAKGHPILNGIEPFKIRDEWYYNMRFPEMRKAATDILRGTPPDATRRTDDSKAHPGREEVLSWAVERPDGGRGFGFTGAHFHKNWGNDNFRKLILNAIVWSAKMEVPKEGIASSVSEEELKENLDPKGRK